MELLVARSSASDSGMVLLVDCGKPRSDKQDIYCYDKLIARFLANVYGYEG